ncbi:hypothetical protein NL529_34290, partial [Klebsiella pneumoniae]|nr:hypothetical protein [Klebsiella pneumoniae]
MIELALLIVKILQMVRSQANAGESGRLNGTEGDRLFTLLRNQLVTPMYEYKELLMQRVTLMVMLLGLAS